MASIEHCIMCFEALDAELSRRKPLTLDELQASWQAYVAAQSAAPKDPALARLAAADAGSGASSSASSLAAGANSTPATSTSSLPLAIAPSSSLPLFVTWNTVEDDGDVALRGCIGTFEAQPLATSLPEYAVISGIHDNRFPPIARSELPELQASVTLLTDFEPIEDIYDWEVGVHGIRLSFHEHGRRYGSTYLPDVAAEQGWTKEEALFSLIRKSGWMGSRSRWKNLELKVTRYQGKKASVEYDEFKQWRDWVNRKQ